MNYKKFIPLITFILVFFLHFLYFDIFVANLSPNWWTLYLKMQQYFIGFSLALAFSYGAFAFITMRKESKGAVTGSAIIALLVWFTSCCGAPMLAIILGILGIGVGSVLLPPPIIALITVLFVSFGYIWLRRRKRTTSKVNL